MMTQKEDCERIFARHGAVMQTWQLNEAGISYQVLQNLLAAGLVERIRRGYYQWIDLEDFSEAGLIVRLFPDGIFCMDTALWHYGYSDRTPREWHIAVDKNSNKTRFKLDYPFVKPYYVKPDILGLGLRQDEMDGHTIQIYDKERVICDCLRYRNKMDREMFNKAIRNYVQDPSKNIAKLMEYAAVLRVVKPARDLIGVWL